MLLVLACANPALEHFKQGATYRAQSQWDEAIAAYTKAIEADRDFAMAYNNRGHSYAMKQEYNKAIGDFTKAIELDPKQDVPYYNRAEIFVTIGEPEKAIADLEKFVELSQDPTRIQIAQHLLAELRPETAP